MHNNHQNSSLLICPICYENFNSQDHLPKLLPACGHTVCLQCVKKLPVNFGLRCPIDKKPFTWNYEGPQSFPTNYLKRDLLGGQEQGRCKIHNKRNKLICCEDKILVCTSCLLF